MVRGSTGRKQTPQGSRGTLKKSNPLVAVLEKVHSSLPTKMMARTKAYFHEGLENWMGDDSRQQVPAMY